jgi:hypothetical protein
LTLIDFLIGKREIFYSAETFVVELKYKFDAVRLHQTIQELLHRAAFETSEPTTLRIPYEIQDKLVDLLCGMLSPHEYRIDMDSVLHHSLFDSFISNETRFLNGSVAFAAIPLIIDPDSERPEEIVLEHLYVFDRLFHACKRVESATVETVFLAADLLHRYIGAKPELPSQGNPAGSARERYVANWKTHSLSIAVVLWIAFKLTNPLRITATDLCALFDSAFTVEQLKQAERDMVLQLNGTFYWENLYTSSYCVHQLIKAFDYIGNVSIYPRIDLQAWKKCDCIVMGSNCDKKISDAILFSHFLKETRYYLISKEHQSNDYVYQIFKQLTGS